MEELIIHTADLHLFEGGAGAAGGEGAGAAASPMAGTQAQAADSQAAETGEESTSADAGQNNPKTPEQLKSEFAKLIRGEYKDAYTAEFQRQFNARFKDVKATQERLDSYQPIIDTLMSRYGIRDGDAAKLTQAIDADEALWSEAAEEAGLTVDQYRRVQRIEQENQRLRSAQQASLQRRMAEQQMQVWQGQMDEVRKLYPDFDMEAELKNPAFKAMLQAGAPMLNAYEAAHIDQVKASIAKSTAASTQKSVIDNIKAKGARPPEVGGSQTGVPLNMDLSKSTAKQRAEWAKRAERGETITFR